VRMRMITALVIASILCFALSSVVLADETGSMVPPDPSLQRLVNGMLPGRDLGNAFEAGGDATSRGNPAVTRERTRTTESAGRARETFVTRGNPVIIGESGLHGFDKDAHAVRHGELLNDAEFFTPVAREKRLTVLLRDNGLHFHRASFTWNDPDVQAVLRAGVAGRSSNAESVDADRPTANGNGVTGMAPEQGSDGSADGDGGGSDAGSPEADAEDEPEPAASAPEDAPPKVTPAPDDHELLWSVIVTLALSALVGVMIYREIRG